MRSHAHQNVVGRGFGAGKGGGFVPDRFPSKWSICFRVRARVCGHIIFKFMLHDDDAAAADCSALNCVQRTGRWTALNCIQFFFFGQSSSVVMKALSCMLSGWLDNRTTSTIKNGSHFCVNGVFLCCCWLVAGLRCLLIASRGTIKKLALTRN